MGESETGRRGQAKASFVQGRASERIRLKVEVAVQIEVVRECANRGSAGVAQRAAAVATDENAQAVRARGLLRLPPSDHNTNSQPARRGAQSPRAG